MNTRWILFLLVIITGQAVAADTPWRTAATPNYRILSQLSDRETADWMRDFDQYILSVSDTLKMDLRALPPLTVVIFAHDRDYTPYKLQRPNGETAHVAGQFERRQTWSMIAMASDSFDAQSRRIIFHEATHWLMGVDQSSQPAWFSEGIAEMFSTFERRGDKVNWGKPINEHLALLRGSGEMPLAQFLAEPSALFDREDHTARFYAQAWAFTHFLMFSKDQQHRQLLIQFLDTFKTQSGEATVNTVFGPSLPDIERKFQIYVDQRSWTYMVQPVKAAAEPPALQPASAELVEASLGLLALGAGRKELAQQHAEKAIELDTSAPDGHAILAYLALDGSQTDLAATHAEAAVQHGSKDSDLFMLLGDSYANGSNSLKPDAARARVDSYENAINLAPWRADPYERLTDALFALDKPREEDAKFLDVGMRVFPGDDWLRVGRALMDDRLGRREAALPALEAVLRPDSKLDPAQRSYATNLRARWLVAAMHSEISDAVNKNDLAGARALLNRYRERIGKAPETDFILQDTDDWLEVNEMIAKFDALEHDKKRTEARALGTQLLARPNLPADLRRYLQQRLGESNDRAN